MKSSFYFILFLLLSSCNFQKQSLGFHQKKFEKSKYTKKAIPAAKEILLFIEKKNLSINLAIPYLLYLSKYTTNVNQQIFYQEKLAKIYLQTPSKINKAIQIGFNLISLVSEDKKNQYRFLIAQSYFKLNKYKQALLELNTMDNVTDQIYLPVLLLKIKIFEKLKLWQKVIKLYKTIKKDFYVEYKKQELALGLISTYEHLSLHYFSLQELKELKKYYIFPHFIQKRISVVEMRIKNRPKIGR